MGPVQQAVRMQDFQVVANRNLRSLELPGQIDDQDAAVAIQGFNNCASSFFIQQMSTRSARPADAEHFSFYCFL